MTHEITEADLEIAALKAELRERGWYVRYTEWPLGHQVVIHARGETSRHRVTHWHRGELEAWRAALLLALAAEIHRSREEAPGLPAGGDA